MKTSQPLYIEWDKILKHLHQLFSSEYKWSVGGVFDGNRRITVVKDDRDATMFVDAELTQEDLCYAGDRLIDMLHKDEVTDDENITTAIHVGSQEP